MDRTVTFKQEETSGHEPQPGLDTGADRLTDRQSQCDFDFDLLLHRYLYPLALRLQFWPWPTSIKFSISLQFTRLYTVGRTLWKDDELVARPLPVHKH
jgi:hypothetical protein